MTRGARKSPSVERLEELVSQIVDPMLEPGPLDRADIRDALCELISLRKTVDAVSIPTLQAADALTELAGV
jgi:hypothetical protein